MGIEIERKFLVNTGLLPNLPKGNAIRQGYICVQKDSVVRVRTYGDDAFITVKSATVGISRSEFEYSIPVEDAIQMLDQLCPKPQIEKTRYEVSVASHVWEIDFFSGVNSGLIVAEIELSDPHEPFEKPIWATTEVSHDRKYRNSNLIKSPYQSW